jgi:hypothetical protein
MGRGFYLGGTLSHAGDWAREGKPSYTPETIIQISFRQGRVYPSRSGEAAE